jgi:hypothetical protein
MRRKVGYVIYLTKLYFRPVNSKDFREIYEVKQKLPRRPGFDPGSVHVGFVVDKVALGQVFSPSSSVFPCKFNSTGVSLQGKTTNHLHHKIAQ